MNKTKYILIFLITVFSAYSSNATVYYFSNSGNDSNNGISPASPLNSITKINDLISIMIPGDVILLERGSIFYGQINISSSGDDNLPITIGAYGKGESPVISGSVPLTNWLQFNENIYTSNVKGIVKNLFNTGKQMTLARFPNSGFLTIDKPFSDPKKGFTDFELNHPASYWKGSIARIRTINWAYEYSVIEDFNNSSLILTTPPFYPVQSGWGYYLDNNLNELDTLNEWYFEKNENESGTVYFYPTYIEDINNMNIEGSIYDYGLFSYKEIRNILIQDLEIRNQNLTGIFFPNKVSNIITENCTFRGQLQIGLSIVNQSEKITVRNCRFYSINGKALSLSNVNNSSVSGNIFINTGMIPGYGTTGDPFVLSAAFVNGNANVITLNYVDGVGHDAIYSLGSGNTVEKNVIKNCLQLLNDGGGLKSYGEYTNNSVWRNNFIFNITGNIENTKGREIVALGIYLDEYTNNLSILNNTIAGSGFSGIGVHDGNNNLIQDNICYNNRAGINFFQNIHGMNNKIISNVIKANNDNQYSVDIKYLGGDYLPGRFDSNYYFIPGNYNSFSVTYNNVATEYSFEKWKTFIRSDTHSEFFIGSEFSFSKLFTNMTDENHTIVLNSEYSYKDINFNNVNGTLILQPWSSNVLFANSDISNLEDLTIAGGPLDFGKINNNNSSDPFWYNISGENLGDPVMITAPEGFEVSLIDDAEFAKTLMLNLVNGKVNNIIFVRFVPDNEKGYNDYVLNKSGSLVSGVKVIGNSR